MSGVSMDAGCMDAFARVKGDDSKYCVYKLTKDCKKIEVISEEKYNKNADPAVFQKFLAEFPDNECRYAVYNANMQLMQKDGFPARRDKIVFISWAPDNASIKQKMLHSSSKDAISKNLEGIHLKWHADDMDGIIASAWIERFDAFPNIKMIGTVHEFEGKTKDLWGDDC